MSANMRCNSPVGWWWNNLWSASFDRCTTLSYVTVSALFPITLVSPLCCASVRVSLKAVSPCRHCHHCRCHATNSTATTLTNPHFESFVLVVEGYECKKSANSLMNSVVLHNAVFARPFRHLLSLNVDCRKYPFSNSIAKNFPNIRELKLLHVRGDGGGSKFDLEFLQFCPKLEKFGLLEGSRLAIHVKSFSYVPNLTSVSLQGTSILNLPGVLRMLPKRVRVLRLPFMHMFRRNAAIYSIADSLCELQQLEILSWPMLRFRPGIIAVCSTLWLKPGLVSF